MGDSVALIGAIFAVLGAFFFLVSAIGIVRLPDFYSRVHAPTKAATLGLALIALGSALQAALQTSGSRDWFWLEDLVLLAIVFVTLPAGAQVLTKSARMAEKNRRGRRGPGE